MGIIYKATNKINNKIYIGKTIQTLNNRKKRHLYSSKIKKYYFYNAINKYGFDNFNWEIIDSASTIKELFDKEIYHIAITSAYTNNDIGYNMTSGGDGGDFLSNHPNKKDIYKRISIKLSGRKHSNDINKKKGRSGIKRPKHSLKMKGENNPMWGKLQLDSSVNKNRYANCKYCYIIISPSKIVNIVFSLKYFCNNNNLIQSSFNRAINNKKSYKNWFGLKFTKEEFDDININDICLMYDLSRKEVKNEIEKFKTERNKLS